MATQRRTQQARRTETQGHVLQTACRLFGEKGYAHTSLEDIALESGLTIRPIYHYFGNKKNLFAAVTESMEYGLAQALESSLKDNGGNASLAGWKAFLAISANPHFRQVVLVDAPNILGRERWASSAVIIKVREVFQHVKPAISASKSELLLRMLIAALAEAALMSVEMENPEEALQEVAGVIEAVMKAMVKT